MNELMLRVKVEQIFQLASPFETGNNMKSIQTKVHPLGFETTSRGFISSYNLALETGPLKRKPSAKEERNIGWFFTRGRGNAAQYINDYYNYGQSSVTIDVDTLNQRSLDNPARNERFLQGLRR